MIYLDHHSTTPLLPEVWEAMRPWGVEYYGNPSSQHTAGRKARQALHQARDTVARLLGAKPDEVIFTSGATESNNLALFGLAGSPPGKLAASPIEHPCVSEPLKQLEARGFEVTWLPVDREGRAREIAVDPTTRLATVLLVNHETGSIQPIQHLAQQFFLASSLIPHRSAFFHCDAAQAVGKLPVSFADLGVTSLSLSAHKFNGPKGIGALLLKRGAKLAPQLFGGHQQQGQRPGTESVTLAVGMAKALEIAHERMEASRQQVHALKSRFLEQLGESCAPVVINGSEEGSPYVLNVAFPGCRAELLLMMLDQAEIACSAGSACTSGSLLPSPVLQAMQVEDDVLRSSMRFSFGPSLTLSEIDEAATQIRAAVQTLRGK
jgi:cysteine desulfurase